MTEKDISKKGMIVIGYPGVGKSTLAAKDRKYLDLESSVFSVDGVRREDWYKEYVVLAEYFSRQGYIVFVSSHGLVQQELIGSKERVVIVYPTLMLYRSWIKKLEDRYDNDPVRKNYVSYQNVKEGILLQVKDMMKSPFERIEIKDMNYDLEQMIAARVDDVEVDGLKEVAGPCEWCGVLKSAGIVLYPSGKHLPPAEMMFCPNCGRSLK